MSVVSSDSNKASVSPSTISTSGGTSTATAGTVSGSVTLTFSMAATTNYNAATSVTRDITVQAGGIGITATGYTGNYDTNSHSITLSSNVAGAVISYGTTTSYGKTLTAAQANVAYTLSEVSRTDAGTTTVY